MNISDYLGNHAKTNLIFDLDRTVAEMKIDWSGVHLMLYHTIKQIDPTLVDSPSTNALEYYQAINKVVNTYGQRGKKQIDKAVDAYEYTHYQGYIPNPTLIHFIKTNQSLYTYHLWTSNTRRVVDDFLKNTYLQAQFHSVITLESITYAKPDPDGFYKIYDRRRDKSEYLMIGDKSTDEYAAKNAGIDYFQENYFNRP